MTGKEEEGRKQVKQAAVNTIETETEKKRGGIRVLIEFRSGKEEEETRAWCGFQF